MMTLIHKAIRLLFITLDSMLAWVIGAVYELIVLIANVDIFGNYIFVFMDRVYAFLAVFMVFKLSISVVNYVLNPDQLVDKSKGFSKLIQRVVIVIILIISVPSIFEWAYDLQSVILNTNTLYTIITGQKNSSNFDPEDFIGKSSQEVERQIKGSAQAAGSMIKYQLLRSFIYAEDSSGNNYAGVNDSGTTCDYRMQQKLVDYKRDHPGKSDATYEFYKYSAGVICLTVLDTVNNTSDGEFLDVDIEKSSDIYVASNKFKVKKDGSFTNYYQLGISTLCLGFTAYMFITICFDVATRTVRLAVLQLMAPIPIISMLDPASGKSGMFSKWLKDCTKTYTDLFIRLGGLYFAIEIITALTRKGSFVWRGTDIGVNNVFVRVFIIIGVLMFAKQLPQFIESITGIKMDTGGMNLGKKLGGVPGLGAAKGLATGAIIGGIGAATGAGAGRGLAGAWQGMRAGMQGKKFNEIRKGQVDANNRMRKAIEDGSTFGGRMEARWTNFWGNRGAMGRIEQQEHTIDERIKDIDNEMAESKRIASQRKQLADNISAQEKRAKDKIIAGEAGNLSTEYLQRQAHIDSLKSQLSATAQNGGNTDAIERQIAQAQVDLNSYLNDVAIMDYIDNSGDAVIANLVNDYNEIARLQGQAIHNTASARHSQMGAAKGEITRIETQNRPHEDEKSRLENQKRDLYENKRETTANKNAIS